MNRFDLFLAIHNKIVQLNRYYESKGAYMLPNSTATRSPVFDKMLKWNLETTMTDILACGIRKWPFHKDGTTDQISENDIYAKVSFLTAIQDADSKTAAYLLLYNSNCKEVTCHMSRESVLTDNGTVSVYFLNRGIFDPDKFSASDVMIHLMSLASVLMNETGIPNYSDFDGADIEIYLDDSKLPYADEKMYNTENTKTFYAHQLDYTATTFVLYTMRKFFDITIEQFIALFASVLNHGFYGNHGAIIIPSDIPKEDAEKTSKSIEQLEYEWLVKRYTKNYGDCNVTKDYSEIISLIKKGVLPNE